MSNHYGIITFLSPMGIMYHPNSDGDPTLLEIRQYVSDPIRSYWCIKKDDPDRRTIDIQDILEFIVRNSRFYTNPPGTNEFVSALVYTGVKLEVARFFIEQYSDKIQEIMSSNDQKS